MDTPPMACDAGRSPSLTALLEEVLPIAVFQWLLTQAQGIRYSQPTGQAVAAAILVRAVLSCLRHQLMINTWQDSWRAASKIAVPSHVKAGDPLMQDLQLLIQARLGDLQRLQLPDHAASPTLSLRITGLWALRLCSRVICHTRG
eukprot:4046836-Amphidinium_carterae.1